jgi:hypothetical protein
VGAHAVAAATHGTDGTVAKKLEAVDFFIEILYNIDILIL